MTHTTARRLILESALREKLQPRDATALHDHCAACPACQRFLASIQANGRAILPVPEPRPSFESDLFDSIMHRSAQPTRVSVPPPRRLPGFRSALAVAASIPAILVSFLLTRGVLSPDALPPAHRTVVSAEQPADPATLTIARETSLPASEITLSIEQGTRQIPIPPVQSRKQEPSRESAKRDIADQDAALGANLPRPSLARREDATTTEAEILQSRTGITADSLAKAKTDKLQPGAKLSLNMEESKTAETGKGTSERAAAPDRKATAEKKSALRATTDDATPTLFRYQPTARLHVEVPDQDAARRIQEHRQRLEQLMTGLMPEGTSISIHPVVKTGRAALKREVPLPESAPDPWKTIVLILWLVFEAGVRILNIIAGSARRSPGLGRFDTALGAILGTLWLPVILVRLVSTPPADQRSSSPER